MPSVLLFINLYLISVAYDLKIIKFQKYVSNVDNNPII